LLIDWVACTITQGASEVTQYIKRGLTSPWVGLDYAPGRFTRTQRCGGISILTDAPNDESIQLVFTGKGCRELEAAGWFESWPVTLRQLLAGGASFSRLDVALDDREGVLNMDHIVACCNEGRVVCRYGKIIPSEERDEVTGAVKGRMVTFGSRGSDTSIRIYDKALQQKAVEQDVSGPWIRVELQARKTRAQALASAVGGDEAPFSGILLSCLDFKGKGRSKRRERLPTAAWWTVFLGTEQRFQLQTAPRSQSIEKTHDWMMTQMARGYASVVDSGLYPTFHEDLLKQGRLKLDLKVDRKVDRKLDRKLDLKVDGNAAEAKRRRSRD